MLVVTASTANTAALIGRFLFAHRCGLAG